MPLMNQLPETVFTTKVDELLNWGEPLRNGTCCLAWPVAQSS